MANRFLNNIKINDEYTLPENDGSAGQAIVTDGSGNLSFGSAVASSADSSESIHILVKNTSGSQIAKGTPVYVTGETGNSGKIEIAPANASDENKMPALGLLETTLNNNAEGYCVQGGLLEGLSTATIDGTSTTANDTVYVKAGGGLTMTKPTGANFIQNIAKVARAHASNGSLVVSSILRTNDVPNLSTGKIWVGDGNTTESTVVHLDETNGRMGVGTPDPASILHVEGVSSTTNLIASSGNGFLRIADSATSATRKEFTILLDNTNNRVDMQAIQQGVAARNITLNASGGNVGIGTTSPATKLHVESSDETVARFERNSGSGYAVLDIKDGVGTTGNSTVRFSDTDGSPGEINYEHADNSLRINTNSSEKLRITSSGEVGIGTTSPYTDLEVVGKASFGVAGSSNLGVEISSVSAIPAAQVKGYIASATSGAGGGNGDLLIASRTNASTNIRFFAGSANEKMRIDSSGNVGIGTTNPTSDLHISDNFPRITLQDTDGTNTLSYIDQDGSYLNLIARNGTNNGNIRFRRYDGTTTTNSMIINSSGNVGIGTTNPATKLHIGTLSTSGVTTEEFRIQSGTSSGNGGTAIANLVTGAFGTSGIYFGNQSTYTSQDAYLKYADSSNATTLNFSATLNLESGSSGSRMYINSVGNVGIGTTSPGVKLDVVSSDSGSQIELTSPTPGIKLIDSNLTTRYAEIKAENGNVNIDIDPGQAEGSSYFSVDIDNSEKFRITNGGNVGIGTTSPSEKLDVVGNIKMTETAATIDTDKFVVLDSGVLKYRTGTQIVSDLPTDSRYVAVAGDTMTGDLILGNNQVDFKTNGSSVSPNFFGHRSAVDLDTRFFSSEGGWSYTTFDSSSSNNPGGVLHNANGLLSFNTHGGNYGHQIAMTTNTAKLYFRTRNNSSWQSWQQVFTDEYHPNADKWTTARTITLGGDLTGSVSLDGSANVTLSAQVVNNSHTHDDRYVELTGDTMTGNLFIGSGSSDNYVRSYFNDGSYTEMRGYGLQFSRAFSYIRPNADNTKSLYLGSNVAQWYALSIDATTTTFNTNGSENMRITSSGDVGIGTDDPSAKLTVVDDILLTGSSPSLTLTDGTSSFAVTTNTNGEGIIKTVADKPIRFFRSNSAETMRIAATTGNVGINTTDPQTGLHLTSGVDNRTVGGTDVGIIRLTNTYGSNYGAGGEIQFGLNDISGRDVLSLIKGSYTGFSLGNYGGDLEFHTRKPDGLGLQQRMTITAAGDVGIGTDSPSSKLEVNTGADGVISRFRGSTNAGVTISGGTYEGVALSAKIHHESSNRNLVLETNGTGKLYFNTDGANARMVINNSGNVSIGTDTTSAKLEVRQAANNGNTGAFTNTHVKLTASATADNTGFVGITAATSTADNYGYSFGAQRTSGGVGDFKINYHNNLAAGVNRFIIDQDGKVGIGTPDPGQKLSVAPSTDVSGEFGYAHVGNVGFNGYGGFSHVGLNSQGNYAMMQSSAGMTFLNASSGQSIRFRINNSDKMTLDSSGELGIGTSGPQTKLHVANGTLRTWTPLAGTTAIFESTQNSRSFITITGANESELWFGDGTTQTKGRVRYENNNNMMEFWTNATARMYINSSGNVGINTSTPNTYKLDVSGTIRATGDVIAYSDIRVKENIKTIDNALNKVKKLRGVEYNKIDSSEKSIGVIAQEIEEVIPQVVKEDDQGMKSVAYGNITAVLIEAIKEQQKQIDELKSQLNAFTK